MNKLVAYVSGTISFKVVGSDFTSGLDTLKKVVGDEAVTISVGKSTLDLVSNLGSKAVRIGVDAENISGQGCFSVDASTIRDITKNRHQLIFSFTKNVLSFHDTKRYKGKIPVRPLGADVVKSYNRTFTVSEDSVRMAPDIMDNIQTAISLCGISEEWKSGKKDLLRHIAIENGILMVSSNSSYHMAMFRKKVSFDGTFHLAISDEYFNIISKVFSKKSDVSVLGITLTSEIFFVSQEKRRFAMILPPIKVEPRAFTIAPRYIHDIKKQKGFKVESLFNLKMSEFSGVMENILSVYKKSEAKFTISVSNQEIEAKVSGGRGDISDVLSISGFKGKPSEFEIDPQIIGNMLTRVPDGEYTFSVILKARGEDKHSRDVFMLKPTAEAAKKLKYELTYVGSLE